MLSRPARRAAVRAFCSGTRSPQRSHTTVWVCASRSARAVPGACPDAVLARPHIAQRAHASGPARGTAHLPSSGCHGARHARGWHAAERIGRPGDTSRRAGTPARSSPPGVAPPPAEPAAPPQPVQPPRSPLAHPHEGCLTGMRSSSRGAERHVPWRRSKAPACASSSLRDAPDLADRPTSGRDESAPASMRWHPGMRLLGSVGSHKLVRDVHLAKVGCCCTAGDETAGARNDGVKRSQAFERLPLIVAITSPSSVRTPPKGVFFYRRASKQTNKRPSHAH